VQIYDFGRYRSWVNGGASNLASIQVGVDGSVFAVTTQQVVVRYNGTTANTWQSLPGRIKSLAVASANLVIGASYVEGIYRSVRFAQVFVSVNHLEIPC